MTYLLALLFYASYLEGVGPARPLVTVPDPRATLPLETETQNAARHARVTEARADTIVVVHRGAWEFAPENTLTAIQAALELGATAVELDFRKTADGVIVLFHDERIERMLDGVGTIREHLYEELLLYSFRSVSGAAARGEQIPALVQALNLARRHAALLHLDIKDEAIDRELLEAIRRAGMLDHVVTYNDYNSHAFKVAGVATMPFKGSLMEEGRDTDEAEISHMLPRPGSMVILDDPRATLSLLGKPPKAVLPFNTTGAIHAMHPPSVESLESVLRGTTSQITLRLAIVRLLIYWPERFATLAPELSQHASTEVRRITAWNIGMLAKHRPELVSREICRALLTLLGDQEVGVRAEAAVACGRAKIDEAVPQIVHLLSERPPDLDQWTNDASRLADRRVIIEARSRYAFALGMLGNAEPSVVEVLIDAVQHRAIHQEVMLVGVDGAMAAFALGRLQASEAVLPLRNALFRDDPVLSQLASTSKSPEPSATPAAWWDFHIRSFILPALAEIGTGSSLAVLRDAIHSGSDDSQSPIAPEMRGQAARELIDSRGGDTYSIIAQLLDEGEPLARRGAIVACLRHSESRYRQLLELRASWAVPWWDAQHQ